MLCGAGSDACARVQDQLLKAWSAIEPNAEACGLALFRWILCMKLLVSVTVCYAVIQVRFFHSKLISH